MTIPVQHDDDDFYINTTLADAQATIAALQAQLNEQSEKLKYHDLFKQRQCWRDPDELVDEYEKWQAAIQEHQALKDQLTQRTAERDTARRRVDELEAREVDVVTLREDLEQRTAELEALKIHCAIVEEHKVIAYKDAANLQAELERVRGELAEERAMMLLTNEVLIPSLQHRATRQPGGTHEL
jgi:chromosome segregation ATPase